MDKAVCICSFVWVFYQECHWKTESHVPKAIWIPLARVSSSGDSGTPLACLHCPTANPHNKPGTGDAQNDQYQGKNVTHAWWANLQQVYQKCTPVWNITKYCHGLKIPYRKGLLASFPSKDCLQECCPTTLHLCWRPVWQRLLWGSKEQLCSPKGSPELGGEKKKPYNADVCAMLRNTWEHTFGALQCR